MSNIESNSNIDAQNSGNFSDIKKNEIIDLGKGENDIKTVDHTSLPVGMRSDKVIKKQHEEILQPKETLDKDLSTEKKDLSTEKKDESDKKEIKTEAKVSDKDLINRDIEVAANKKSSDKEIKSDEKSEESKDIKKEEVHEETIIEKAKDIAIDAKDAIIEGAHVVTDSIKGAYEKTLEFFKSN